MQFCGKMQFCKVSGQYSRALAINSLEILAKLFEMSNIPQVPIPLIMRKVPTLSLPSKLKYDKIQPGTIFV